MQTLNIPPKSQPGRGCVRCRPGGGQQLKGSLLNASLPRDRTVMNHGRNVAPVFVVDKGELIQVFWRHAQRRVDEVHGVEDKQWHGWIMAINDAEYALREKPLLKPSAVEPCAPQRRPLGSRNTRARDTPTSHRKGTDVCRARTQAPPRDRDSAVASKVHTGGRAAILPQVCDVLQVTSLDARLCAHAELARAVGVGDHAGVRGAAGPGPAVQIPVEGVQVAEGAVKATGQRHAIRGAKALHAGSGV